MTKNEKPLHHKQKEYHINDLVHFLAPFTYRPKTINPLSRRTPVRGLRQVLRLEGTGERPAQVGKGGVGCRPHFRFQ